MTTRIGWCDETNNVSTGCNRVAPECDECYAIGVAHRGLRPEHEGLTKIRPKGAPRPGPDWNGVVHLHPDRLLKPSDYAGRKRVFVNSMSDLFHDQIPSKYIAATFGMAALFSQHTFIILTKRIHRARIFDGMIRRFKRPAEECVSSMMQVLREHNLGPADGVGDLSAARQQPWPLPNVWLGVSVGTRANLPWIEQLLHVQAAVHIVSFEPLLEDLGDLGDLLPTPAEQNGGKPRFDRVGHLGWGIIGGESSHKKSCRPCDVKWIRRLAEQLRFANVPTFVKQMGSRAYSYGDPWDPFVGRYSPSLLTEGRLTPARRLVDAGGSDPFEWPTQLQIQEHPRAR